MSITTKWPRLLVVGENVTEGQADEILIRTNSWSWLSSNDRTFQAAVETVAAEFGRPAEIEKGRTEDHDEWLIRWREHMKAMDAWSKSIGELPLHHLGNDRVMSSWIGGPHGWCDWDGTIGCSTHNIGKWPSDAEVTEDWTLIAEAFPFLNLTAQCIDEEGEGPLAAEWRVKGGKVEYNAEPTKQICGANEPSYFSVLLVGGERGVSLDRLRQAFRTTLERREAAKA